MHLALQIIVVILISGVAALFMGLSWVTPATQPAPQPDRADRA